MTHCTHEPGRRPCPARFLALLCLLSGPLAPARAQVPDAELPVIDAPVTDLAGVLSESGLRLVEGMIRDHQAATGVQLAILVVSTTAGEPIEDYSLRVATRWRGGSAARDEGVLYVLAVNDRRQRLEVGYGLEDRISDASAARILDGLIPYLRDGDYDGVVRSVANAVEAYTTDFAPPEESADVEEPGLLTELAPTPVYGAIALLGTFVGMLHRRKAASARTQEIALNLRPSADYNAMIWMALYAFFMGTGAGLLGFGWFHYLGAFVGLFAGWRFAWENILTTLHYLFMVAVFGAVFGPIVTAMTGEPVVGVLAAFAVQCMVTLMYAGGLRSNHTSFTATGVKDEDQAFYDQVRAPSVWHAPTRSKNAGHFGGLGSSSGGFGSGSSSSRSSSSSGSRSSHSSSSSSSSRSSGYSGGGGRFGGGGASSSW